MYRERERAIAAGQKPLSYKRANFLARQIKQGITLPSAGIKRRYPPCWAIQIIQQPLSELLPTRPPAATILCCWRCRHRQKYIHQMYELDHVPATSCSKMRLRAPHRQNSTTTLTTCYFVNLISGPDYFNPLSNVPPIILCKGGLQLQGYSCALLF